MSPAVNALAIYKKSNIHRVVSAVATSEVTAGPSSATEPPLSGCTRAPGARIPDRFSGSAAEMISSPAGADRRTARNSSTASGVANCSPTKPEMNRPPLTSPRAWFRDQPRVPRANKIAMLPDDHGILKYWIDPELLSGVPENQRLAKLSQILKTDNGRSQPVVRLQPIYDESEQELKGYVAFTTP